MTHKQSGTHGVIQEVHSLKCTIVENVKFARFMEAEISYYGMELVAPCTWEYSTMHFVQYNEPNKEQVYLYPFEECKVLISDVSLEQSQNVLKHYEGKPLYKPGHMLPQGDWVDEVKGWERKDDAERFLGIWESPSGEGGIGEWFND